MRQFLGLRFWLTLACLAGLLVVLFVVFAGDDDAADGAAAPTNSTHRIDLVQWVFSVAPADGFEMVDGVATTDLAIVIDGSRTMVVKAGTPGEIDCPRLTSVAQCTVAADLLGDAVLWFSIVRGPPTGVIHLPGVVDILDDGWVLLDNDWIVRHAEKVERKCDEETTSLSSFIATFGDEATSTYSFESQQIISVTCP